MDSPTKPLRLFFAVPVTEEIRSGAAALLAELAKTGADAKWLDPAAMHLTLRFLGATPPDRVPALERALDAAARGRAPFSVELDRLGCFGPARAPKVVWVGVGAGLEPLESLAGALTAALAAEGVPPEDRPFAAHLTLGRLRSPRGAARLAKALESGAPRWTCPVDRVTLYSSVLSPRGSVHSPLRERRLGE